MAKKWDYSARRQKNPGRPAVSSEIVKLVVRLAKENPCWGYDRIQGALANLGHDISDSTVANILKEHGIEPAPEAIDFTTLEVWGKNGLVTIYLLFVIELATRRVHFAGSTTTPDEIWIKQIARNLTAADEGFLEGKRYVLIDRDTKFSTAFRCLLKGAGAEPVLLPPRSPNLNAYLERFHRSLKAECLERIIFFGESSLRKAITEFLAHYHAERNHQGLDNRLIAPGKEVGRDYGQVECRERLGGLLNYYYRQAA